MLFLFEQWNFMEFLYLCHFFPHLLLSDILERQHDWRISIAWRTWSLIFLILVIMFCCIKLRLSNSSDDFRICQKICFWSNKIFICIYIVINCKISWRLTPVLTFFKLCCKQLKRIIVIRLASCLTLRTYAGFPEAVYQWCWWDAFPSCS